MAAWSDAPLTRDAARALAARTGQRWQADGVDKWIAHDPATGALVGRGGLSRTPLVGRRSAPARRAGDPRERSLGDPTRLEVGWAVREPRTMTPALLDHCARPAGFGRLGLLDGARLVSDVAPDGVQTRYIGLRAAEAVAHARVHAVARPATGPRLRPRDPRRGPPLRRGRAGRARRRAFTEVHNARFRAVMERLGMRYDREIRLPGLVERRPGVHPDALIARYVADLSGASG